MKFPTIGHASLVLAALILSACGGGASTSSNPPPIQTASCNPADPATFDQCGTVLIGLTDAEGDFLNYSVDVLSLTLETANGRIVEVMPQQARINFTDYVDLTELVAAVHVPPAVYVAGINGVGIWDELFFVNTVYAVLRSLFPYRTVDQLHDAHRHSGPLTVFYVERVGSSRVRWKPFAES